MRLDAVFVDTMIGPVTRLCSAHAGAHLDLGMRPEARRWLEAIPAYFRGVDSYREVAARLLVVQPPQPEGR